MHEENAAFMKWLIIFRDYFKKIKRLGIGSFFKSALYEKNYFS